MIVGFGPQVIPANADALFQWACDAGQDGEVLGVHLPPPLAPFLLVIEFGLRRAGDADVVEHLVVSKKVPAPSWKHVMCSCGASQPAAPACARCGKTLPPAPDVWQGGVDGMSFQALANEHPIAWDVEEGDTLFVRLMNISANMQHFSMGIRIGDRTVSKEKHWWANEETGKLVRPMTFAERKLKRGTRIGGLIVVDPDTYDGFDPGTHEGQATS